MKKAAWLLTVGMCILLPAVVLGLTYTTPNTTDGVVEGDSPVLGGTTWETDENMDTDGSTNFYFTWDDTAFFCAITGPYADMEDGDYDWFIAIDTDQLPGSGGTTNPAQDGIASHVTFSGQFLPEYIYAFAGGLGWHVSFAWDGAQWLNRGWSDAGTYGGWDGNLVSEITMAADTLGTPDSLAIVSWISTEDNSTIVASYPHANPIGASSQQMTHFWVAKNLGSNVAPNALPILPPPGAAVVDNERSYEFTCTAMADITPGDCGSTTQMAFYYTSDGSQPDSNSSFVTGTYDTCTVGADTTDAFYAVIPAPDDATVTWTAKGVAKNGIVDWSDTTFTFVQGGTAWVGNAGSSPTTCTVWAEIYVGDGGESTSISFPYTTDGSDPRVSATADTADGIFDTQLGNNDKFYAVLADPSPGDTVTWYAFGTDANDNFAQTDTFFVFVQSDTADYYNMTCVPDSNYVLGEVAPKGPGSGVDYHWTTDGTDPKTSETAHVAKGFFVEDSDTTGKYAAYLTADVGQTIKWYGHVYGSDNSFVDTPNYECVAGVTSGPTLCNLTCAPDSAIIRASISPRGFGSEIGFYVYLVRAGGAQTDTLAFLENNYLRDEDTPGGDCSVPVGVFQKVLPGSIAAGDTIRWYAYGYYRPDNKYSGLFGSSPTQSCVAETTIAGIDTKGLDPLVPRITNVPNPFGGSTQIVFDLARKARVNITVYDIRGRQVDMVFEGVLPQGEHSVTWDGETSENKALPSGIYFYRFQAGDYEVNKKAILIR